MLTFWPQNFAPPGPVLNEGYSNVAEAVCFEPAGISGAYICVDKAMYGAVSDLIIESWRQRKSTMNSMMRAQAALKAAILGLPNHARKMAKSLPVGDTGAFVINHDPSNTKKQDDGSYVSESIWTKGAYDTTAAETPQAKFERQVDQSYWDAYKRLAADANSGSDERKKEAAKAVEELDRQALALGWKAYVSGMNTFT